MSTPFGVAFRHCTGAFYVEVQRMCIYGAHTFVLVDLPHHTPYRVGKSAEAIE